MWGIYFIARFLVLNEKMSSVGIYLLIVGVVIIIVFGEQKKDGIVKGIFRGLIKLPPNIMTGIGSFSDLVSYLRLFAVGLATKEVAVTFNTMAMDLGFGSFLLLPVTILILMFGHTINLALAAMAVLVHGVRLNLLECSKHLNIQWSGIPYRPFKLSELK